ncbi:MAG: UDP-N-acetylmuramoyl-L-alanyl-D-glutamate--2,6-diaminopimelate ligase [Thermoleophilia bacterium]|nr:UDP-N-acetylmuramoyl-L-alanyl-D-glutamate--2,6-diaminopimelate ligase [Thermoleophilia bacterium]
MLLTDLLGPVLARGTTLPIAGVDVVDLAYDSRRVADGTLFFCAPGTSTDGHDHAEAAIAAGAVALVVERVLPIAVVQVVAASTRAVMGPLADTFFGHPSHDLRVLAVTGTNGKTTTAYLQHAILTAAGHQTGLLGTIERRIGGTGEAAARTTAEAIDLHRDLRRMVDAGDTACAMEVSSHALEQQREGGVRFAAAAFTNLTRDHLDYHPSMDAYFAAKALLFDGRCPTATNADDAYGCKLAADLRFGVATAAAEVRAEQISLGPAGTRFRLCSPWGEANIETHLVGLFNVENALAAASTAGLAGLGMESIVTGLAAVPGVPGRLEVVSSDEPFAVIVDYAHTADALANVLRALRQLASGRVIVVFGCGGDRDRGKRPEMARVACALADHVIITSDNPRSEDPQAIVDEALVGAEGQVEVELDRRAAIARSIALAGPGDVVLIAGKGHEQGQDSGGVVTPFDDRVVAREVLA